MDITVFPKNLCLDISKRTLQHRWAQLLISYRDKNKTKTKNRRGSLRYQTTYFLCWCSRKGVWDLEPNKLEFKLCLNLFKFRILLPNLKDLLIVK